AMGLAGAHGNEPPPRIGDRAAGGGSCVLAPWRPAGPGGQHGCARPVFGTPLLAPPAAPHRFFRPVRPGSRRRGRAAPARGGDAVDRALHLVLPVVTLALVTAGSFVRFVRGAMIDALGAPFIRTARAKGAGRAGVVLRHALPQAMPTIVTLVALQLGAIFGGA